MIRRVALLAAPLAALAWTGGARADVTTRYNAALNGGVAIDGWAGRSTEATTAAGTVRVQIPSQATVERAFLVSATGATEAGLPRGELAPVAGTPRQVTLGSGAKSQTFALEGAPPDRIAGTAFGAFTQDVTDLVRSIVGISDGNPVDVAIVERGDGPALASVIYGHTLIVVFRQATAPLRNVVVATGAFGGPAECAVDATASFTLAQPVVKCGDPYPLSLSLANAAGLVEETAPVSANGVEITAKAGGWDDDPSHPSNQSGGDRSACYTAGSIGARGLLGPPVTIAKTYSDGKALSDVVRGPLFVGDPRGDDELWDVEPQIPRGTRAITVRLANPTVCTFASAIVVQTNAGGVAGGCLAGCVADEDCNKDKFCDDGLAPKTCRLRFPNGAKMPNGGTIQAKCTPAAGLRACQSGVCDPTDDACGLANGAACGADAHCRSGVCAGGRCFTPDAPDGGAGDAGAGDAGSDAGDAGEDLGPFGPTTPPRDPTKGVVEGGGLSCSEGGGAATPFFPIALAVGVVAALRRRRQRGS